MGAVEPRRGCDGGGSGDIFGACVAGYRSLAEARQLPQGLAVGRGFQSGWRSRVGAVEPRRGCDGGGSGGIFGACVAAIAASLKLDSSHKDWRWVGDFSLGGDQGWELSSPGEAAMAVGQATSLVPVLPSSQPRWGSTAPTGIGAGAGISVWVEIKFGSCRAPARLRWRWVRRHLWCLCCRYRSLAGARQLLQGLAVGRSRTLPGLTPQSMAITPLPRPASFLRA
ncbi:hypothetical protein PS834_01397 [Pseudomonas fluorescens]|nr:hypothetical protein PS834_01397 [Pseudomonas fluorescens]